MSDRRLALAVACVIAVIALVATLASARAMAAPPPPTPTAKSGVSPSGTQVCFYRDHTPACVSRTGLQAAGSMEEQARALLQALVAGPSTGEQASGLRSELPLEAELADVIVEGDSITVKLILPEAFLYGKLDPLVSDEINEQVVKTLYPIEGLHKFHVLASDPRAPNGAWKSLSYFLFEPPPVRKEEQVIPSAPNQASTSTGALSGKAVYLSAGHGWTWITSTMDWRTQRPAYNEIIEDMNNAEVVNQYLVQYLRNAGADVWPVREQDMITREMIVVHGQPAYAEQGAWSVGSSPGYLGLNYRYANTVTGTATATATWTFTPTVAGRYNVYAWYLPSSNRAPDAHYLIAHDGGLTEVRVDQRVHGATWRYIGDFFFSANRPARVMLTNQSATTNTAVIADAIRVGGGMGTETGDGPPSSPGTSGKPRWEEAARYWAEYQGAPPKVYMPCSAASGDDCDDVTARPLYAEWEHSSSEDAVFVSWHTNGGGGRGTESYIYDGAWGGTFTPGSDQLQSWLQSTLISDTRAGWESDWTDRGRLQANFGEVRALQTMPGTLVEIAFHDQEQDAEALQDARFAQLTARAMYKGILRYFAQKDGTTPVVLPEPPRNLIVRNSGNGQVTVSWRPSPTDTNGLLGDAATGYRVYTSADGFGWSSPMVTSGTSFTLNGLAPSQLIFVRVTATNAGGESFPTPVAAARVAQTASAPVLVVNGYERIDRWMDVQQCDTPVGSNCPNLRIWPWRMNDQSYVVQHAMAISLPLDSATRAALDDHDLALESYAIVDWIAGQEQTPAPVPNGTSEVALTSAERVSITAFLNQGGALFLSGAEVAFDLATNLGAQAFLTGTLHAQYASDDAGTFSVAPSASEIFTGLAPFDFDDGSHGAYAVNYPDVITPTNGSLANLSYVGGAGGTAGLQYANGCQRLVYLGFPFETLYPDPTRQAVMSRVINFLVVCPTINVLSPSSNGFYNHVPSFTGITGGWTPGERAEVALVQITTPLRFLSGTTWVTRETWISGTGGSNWAFTPGITLTDGPYAVWARAWNSYGLSGTHDAIVSFTMDTISPTTPVIITPTGGVSLTGSSVTLVYSPAADANGVAGYTVQVDDKLYTTTATLYLASGLHVGQHTWGVSAFDAAGNSSNWVTATFATDALLVYLPLITRDYSPPVTLCQELVTNGGFELPGVYWYSLSVTPTYVVSPVHSGSLGLLIGYMTTDNMPTNTVYSSIQQTVTIPLTATQTTLTFWRYSVSSDSRDAQYVSVGASPISATQTVWIGNPNERAWTLTSVNLSPYSGSPTIRFGAVNTAGGGVTAMYLDDVSVQACSP